MVSTTAPQDNLELKLNRLPTLGGDLKASLSSPEPNVQVRLGDSGPIALTDSTGTATFPGVANGSYQLNYSKDGFEPGTQAVTVNGDTSVALPLTVASDVGQTQAPAVDPSPALQGEDSVVVPPDPESVPSNTAFQGYFTSVHAAAYIGDVFLDEMQVIQWALQSNTVPIYGYASRDADAFAQGKCLIQGQLVLNYVVDDYLMVVLDEYNKKSSGSVIPDPSKQKAVEYASLMAKKQALQSQSASPGQQQLISQAQNRMNTIIQGSSPDELTQIKQEIKNRSGATPNSKRNACYDSTVFDIRIEIGEGAAKTTRWLRGCKLTANEQIVNSATGESILDSYSFICRQAH